jgi:uncharacterized protein
MSAPAVIDSLEFARTAQTLHGRLPVPGLERLRDNLYDALGEIEFAVTGGHDARGRPTLTLEINGTLHLRCQRCLGILDFPVRLINTVLLVEPAEANATELDEEPCEWIEASVELDIAALLEDEIIMSLPYAPRHDEGLCRSGLEVAANETRTSAFAALAALKKDRH